MSLTITTLKNERGVATAITVGERMVTVFMSDNAIPEIAALGTALADVGELISAQVPNLTPTGQRAFAEKTIDRMKAKFLEGVASVTEYMADNAKRTADFHTPIEQAPAVETEQRTYARTLPLPALMDMINRDAALANAVVAGGLAMSGLPADIFERVRDEMAIGNLTVKLMAQRTYRTAPSAADPIGGQPDRAAARKAAEEIMTALSDERDRLDEARTTLATVVDAVAVLTDKTRDGAYALLTA